MDLKKVALIVQRSHKSVVGGSESEALHYAELLKNDYAVHILTTTATDPVKWENVLEAGDELSNGFWIKRFRVSQGRAEYWHRMYHKLTDQYSKDLHNKKLKIKDRLITWPLGFQEEIIYKQGPYSYDMIQYLRENAHHYSAFIFFTYLYPTTYFGIFDVPKKKILFVPTLHDEPPAYLSAFKYAAKRAKTILWNAHEERAFAKKLWQIETGRVIGMGVKTKKYKKETNFCYLLYCGRIDVNKGCQELVDFFLNFKKKNNNGLKLVFTGTDYIGLPKDKDIIFEGFVPDTKKLRLMAGADAFVMPSTYESFSIVTLEAMAQKTPVIVNAGSEVLKGHVKRSGGGLLYHDYHSFSDAIKTILGYKKKAEQMGMKGRQYAIEYYSMKRVREMIIEEIEKVENTQ